MKQYNNLLTKFSGEILVVVINRPSKLNSLNKQTIDELEDIILTSHQSKAIRGVILTGSGDRSFVSGADINEFIGFDNVKAKEMSTNGHRILSMIENGPIPYLAAINGYAVGGGCELAMACHLRVAADSALFSQPESKLGIIPGFGGTQRLVQYIGKTKAMELMMTGETINAEKALKYGLINYIVSRDELIHFSTNILNKILLNSQFSIKGIIRSVNAFFEPKINGFDVEIEQFSRCFTELDFNEGISAFLEKREPKYNRK